ncbi:MAG: sigma-70 family RNA polymerase sigma factor [Planctomycetota bacterium]
MGAQHPLWDDLFAKVDAKIRRRFSSAKIPAPYDMGDLVAITTELIFRDLANVEVRDRVSFWLWVRRIADHALADMARKARALKRGGHASVQSLDATNDSSPDLQVADRDSVRASVAARVGEVQDGVLQCLRGMPPVAAEVLRLRLFEHRDYAEIAKQVDRYSIETIRSIFMRGRQRLAECMRAKGFDDVS